MLYIDTQQIYQHHKHLSWLIRILSDRECLTKSLGYSIFASLLQSSTSTDNQSASSIDTIYPSSLKLILTKHKEFIDYMFGSIKTSPASLVRIYCLDCLRLILNLYLNYKSYQVNKEQDDEKKCIDDDDDDETRESLMDLMEKYVLNRISDDIDITKLLHDVTGNAAYFKSICQLLKALIMCNITKFKNVPFEAMHFARFRHLLNFSN